MMDGETPGSSKQNDSDRTSPLSTLFNSGSTTDGSQSNKEGAHTISDDDDEGDIDDWMGEESCDDNADDADEYDLFGDLENFFQGQEETGPKVQERIAKVTERAKKPKQRVQQKEIQFSKQEVNVRISNTLPFKLINTTENFVAGKTKNFKENWHKLTTDPWIRNTITGYQVEMNDHPVQISEPKPLNFSYEEQVYLRRGEVEV